MLRGEIANNEGAGLDGQDSEYSQYWLTFPRAFWGKMEMV